MRPFLEQVADHYIKAGGISGRCFIFPNRRSQGNEKPCTAAGE